MNRVVCPIALFFIFRGAKLQNFYCTCKFFCYQTFILTFQSINFMYVMREGRREPKREGKTNAPPVLNPYKH